ncbi:MAG TPA: hypothetical protein VMQ44_03020 [Candidatus Saccharimonadales bacterium]|nr:hypothetical protein [Candidatus Saccharimonadales bacterium]
MFKGFAHFWLIVLLLLSTIGFTLYRLQDPNFLTSEARQVNLYSRALNQYDALLPTDSFKTGSLTKDDVKTVLTAAIDGSTFYDMLGQYLTSELHYLTGQSIEPNFNYDLTAIKGRASDKTAEVLNAKYDALPVCGANQTHDWSLATQLPSCKLADTNIAQTDISRSISALATKAVEPLPDKISLTTTSPASERNRQIISIAVKVVKGIWLATGILLLLYLIFRRRKAFLPLGIIFLFVGVIQVGLSLFVWDWLGRNVTDLLVKNPHYAAYSTTINNTVSIIVQVLKTIFGTLSIVTLGVGVGCLALAIFWRPKPILGKL